MKSKPAQNAFKALKAYASRLIIYVLTYTTHPDELDVEVMGSLIALREAEFQVLSQSVFQRDINQVAMVLERLFKRLYYAGVAPYYIYRCAFMHGLEQYVRDLTKERQIMAELLAKRSGIAFPLYVADIAGDVGKIPIPLGFLEVPNPAHGKNYNNRDAQL